jgi:ribonuclease-3
MSDLVAFQQSIGIQFKSPELLRQALTHSSYVNENPNFVSGPNERLEFLGDAVLGLVIAEKLYDDYPNFPEGELTKLRSLLVRQETLTAHALELKINEHLYLGRGEEAGGGRLKPANLEGAFEALTGAIYLDRGLETCRGFILQLFKEQIPLLLTTNKHMDDKSKLQEFIQALYQVQPVYTVVKTSGPSHEPLFTVEVSVGDKLLGSGTGKSKKSAETAAAHSALAQMGND